MPEVILAVDAMGGDHGPEVTVPAVAQILERHAQLRVLLVGDSSTLEAQLERERPRAAERITVPTFSGSWNGTSRLKPSGSPAAGDPGLREKDGLGVPPSSGRTPAHLFRDSGLSGRPLSPSGAGRRGNLFPVCAQIAMIVLVAYDISKDRTRAKFHAFLKEYGLNTQKSVFECEVDEQAIRDIEAKASSLIDEDSDSVRIYRICSFCARRTVISGQGIKVTNLDYTVL